MVGKIYSLIRKVDSWLFGLSIEEMEALFTIREGFIRLHQQSILIAYYQCRKAKVIPETITYQEFHSIMDSI